MASFEFWLHSKLLHTVSKLAVEMDRPNGYSRIITWTHPRIQPCVDFRLSRIHQRWSLGLDVSASRWPRDLILIVSVSSRSRLEQNFKHLRLVSVSGKIGKVSPRSRLEQTFKRLGLVSVSKEKVSFASLGYMTTDMSTNIWSNFELVFSRKSGPKTSRTTSQRKRPRGK